MRIIHGTDLSLEALAGTRLTASLAEAYQDSGTAVEVELLHVVRPRSSRDSGAADSAREEMERAIHNWASEQGNLRDFDVACLEGPIAQTLRERAETTKADYLVLGQTGLGTFARMTLGSTALKVAQNPPCNLLIAHRDFTKISSPLRIVVGIDFNEASQRALTQAANLARTLHGELDLVHVTSLPLPVASPDGMISYAVSEEDMAQAEAEGTARMKQFLDTNASLLKDLEIRTRVLAGSPTRQLVEYATTMTADFLCLGSVAHSRLERVLLGSVASGVVRHMPCSILLSPPDTR